MCPVCFSALRRKTTADQITGAAETTYVCTVPVCSARLNNGWWAEDGSYHSGTPSPHIDAPAFKHGASAFSPSALRRHQCQENLKRKESIPVLRGWFGWSRVTETVITTDNFGSVETEETTTYYSYRGTPKAYDNVGMLRRCIKRLREIAKKQSPNEARNAAKRWIVELKQQGLPWYCVQWYRYVVCAYANVIYR